MSREWRERNDECMKGRREEREVKREGKERKEERKDETNEFKMLLISFFLILAETPRSYKTKYAQEQGDRTIEQKNIIASLERRKSGGLDERRGI